MKEGSLEMPVNHLRLVSGFNEMGRSIAVLVSFPGSFTKWPGNETIPVLLALGMGKNSARQRTLLT